jgi:hypothetical protein
MMGNREDRHSRWSFTKLVRKYEFFILSLGFGLAALTAILAFVISSTPRYVVGENWVLNEVQVLPGLYMKPITIFQYSFFLCFAFALYTPHVRAWFMHVKLDVLMGIYVVAWFVALATGFEVMYHIVLWSASLAAGNLSNPDTVVNPWPRNNPYPVNIVFAAKTVVLIFVIALFLIDYIQRTERARTTQLAAETGNAEPVERGQE